MILILALIQGAYIIYMLNYFKTKYSLSHPATLFESNLLYHPIGISDNPISNVCNLGHILSWYYAGFIILRAIFINYGLYDNLMKNISIVVLMLGVCLSFLNFNVVVYLLPQFILEYNLIKNNFIINY